MQVVSNATLSRLLPLQLGFEQFQYIGLTNWPPVHGIFVAAVWC